MVGKFSVLVFMGILTVPAGAKAREPLRGGVLKPPKPPEVLPATETGEPPEGYRREQRPRIGLIVTGLALGGVGALLFAGGLDARAEASSTQPGVDSYTGGGPEMMMILGAGMFATGIPLFVYGMASPRDVYVKNPAHTMSLAVSPTPANLGARLSLYF
ncbi:MAG: hypothetical protein ACOY0T_37840 [Myxococcota bacterium]